MAHTERYYKLKKLERLLNALTHIVHGMAFNEDLFDFDTELENDLENSYCDLMNRISKLQNDLKL